MRVLPFTDRVNSPALSNQASHSWIFVPDVAELNLRDLAQRIVRAAILLKPKHSEFANELARGGRAEDVQGQF